MSQPIKLVKYVKLFWFLYILAVYVCVCVCVCVCVYSHLGSLGDLLPLEIFGDFLPTQSSLSSMSLESEQLQLSIMEEISVLL